MGIDTGKYVGYTLGGSQPTLYFEKGRYTQEHKDSDNVGWHPIPADRICHRHNISAAGKQAYNEANATKKEVDFASKVLSNTYNSAIGDATATLCEITTDTKGNYIKRHLSRGMLIEETEDSSGGRKAAIDWVRANGKLADNAK